MTVYNVTVPTGETYRVNAPIGATREQVIEVARQKHEEAIAAKTPGLSDRAAERAIAPQLPIPTTPKEEDGFFSTIVKGIGAGAVGTLESAALGAAAMLPEGAETSARDVIKSVADWARPELTNPNAVAAQIAQGVGSTAAFIPAMFLGPVGGIATAAGLATAAGAGEASERAREKGATEEERSRAAALGMLPGALDVVPLGRLTRRLATPGITAVLNKLGPEEVTGIKSRIYRALTTGGVEGATEAIQNVGQNLIEQGYSPDTPLLGGTLGEAAVGGAAGTILQTIFDLLPGRQRGVTPPPKAEEPGIAGLLPPPPVVVSPAGTAVTAEQRSAYEEGVRKAQEDEAARNALPPEEVIAPRRWDEEARIAAEEARAKTEEAAPVTVEEARTKAEEARIAEEETAPVAAEEAAPVAAEETAPVAAEEAAPVAAEEAAITTDAELADIAARQEGEREQTTTQRRNAILGTVLTDLGTASRVNVEKRFTKALEDAGVTDTAPTETERATIKRATDIYVAKPVEKAKPEVTEVQTENVPLEEAVAPRPVRTAEQPSFPGMGRAVREQAALEAQAAQQPWMRREGEPTEEPVEPRILNETELDTLGIPKAAPVRKRVVGQDFNIPAVRQQLATYAGLANAPLAAKANIDRLLSNAPEAQLELGLWKPKKGRKAEAPKAQAAGAKGEQFTVLGDTISAADADTAGRRGGVSSSVQETRPAGEPKVTPTTGPDAEGLATAADNIIGAITGKGGKPAAVKKVEAKPEAKKVEAKPVTVKKVEAKPEAKKVEAKPEAKKVEAKPEAKKVEAKPEPEAKKGEAETLKLRLWQRWRNNASAAVQQFVDAMGIGKAYSDALPEPISGTPDPTTIKDKRAVLDLVANEPKTARAKAARVFFSKVASPEVALHEMAYAKAMGPEAKYRRAPDETALEAAYFNGLTNANATAAIEWVQENMSPTTNAWMDKLTKHYENEAAKIASLVAGDRVEAKRAAEEMYQQSDYVRGLTYSAKLNDLVKKLPGGSVAGFLTPLHPITMVHMKNGDLVGALRSLVTTSPSDRVAQVARKLAQVVGTTKLEVVKNLTHPDGTRVAGLFDPKTNTIKLDAELGMNSHTLLHEATHMAVSETLANPNHPMTRQLAKLFESVKDVISNRYATTSVDEFASEVFSNPELQSELAMLRVDGAVQEPISALRKFFNIVGNFVRRMLGMETKPVTSALNEADKFIEGMLSTAPTSRVADELMLKTTGKAAADTLRKMFTAAPTFDAAGAKRLGNFLNDSSIVDKIKRLLLYLNPLYVSKYYAKKYIPSADTLSRIIDLQSKSLAEETDSLNDVIKELSAWMRKNPTLVDLFNETVHDSTRYQVDPSLTLEQARAKYGKEADADHRLKEWARLRKNYNKLGDGGQNAYKTLRNTYKSMYDRVGEVLAKRLDVMGLDETTKKRVVQDIYTKLYKKGLIEPYFPLYRKGEFWLSYTATDPKTGVADFYVEAFESKAERNKAQQELEADKALKAKDIRAYRSLGEVDYKRAPSGSFVNDILKTLQVNKVDARLRDEANEALRNAINVDPTLANDPTRQQNLIDQYYKTHGVTDKVMNLFLDLLPESSFMQGFRSRYEKDGVTGRLGYRNDALLALKHKGASLTRQLNNIEYGAQLSQVIDKIKEEAKSVSGADSDSAALFANDLIERAKFAMSPGHAPWSNIGSSLGFNWMLGSNVSSAMLNIANMPMVVMPYLGGKYGMNNTMRALGMAGRMFMSSGRERTIETYGPDGAGKVKKRVAASYSLDNYDFDAKDTPQEIKLLRTLVDTMSNRAMLNRSGIQDVLDMEGVDNPLVKLNAVTGWMFHHGDRMQRQMTAASAYLLELSKKLDIPLNKLGDAYKAGKISEADMKAAAQEAVNETEITNGSVAAAAGARISQSDIGRIVWMFKRYPMMVYSLLARLIPTAIKGTPEDRKMAQRQLVYIFTSTALLAGVSGLPMFGAIAYLFDLFRDDDEDDFRTAFRKMTGEEAYGGALNYIFGVDVASRIGLSDLIFRHDQVGSGQSAIITALEQLGGPVVGVGMNIERGLGKINEGHIERGIEDMLPSSIKNVLRGLRYGYEGGATTMRGDYVTEGLGPKDAFAQALGFTPTAYSNQLMQNAAVKKIDNAVKAEKSKLYRQYYLAMRTGDRGETNRIIAKIIEHNRKHPGAAITADGLRRSLAANIRTSAMMEHGITLSKGMRAELLKNAEEFDDGISLWD
jgi:hypothetical protein